MAKRRAKRQPGVACIGNDIVTNDGRNVIASFGSPSEAKRAAREMVAPAGSTVESTAFSIIAMDFEDAGEFWSVVNVDAAMQSDLESETDDEVVKLLTKRTAAQVERAHRRSAAAKQVDRSFSHRGKSYGAGHYVVRDGESTLVLSAEDFELQYRPASSK